MQLSPLKGIIRVSISQLELSAPYPSLPRSPLISRLVQSNAVEKPCAKRRIVSELDPTRCCQLLLRHLRPARQILRTHQTLQSHIRTLHSHAPVRSHRFNARTLRQNTVIAIRVPFGFPFGFPFGPFGSVLALQHFLQFIGAFFQFPVTLHVTHLAAHRAGMPHH
jgi:hypothetical protein